MQTNYDYKSKETRTNEPAHNRFPKGQFFRTSLKSREDLGFPKYYTRQDNNNQPVPPTDQLKPRQTLNRPEPYKYISQTTKNEYKQINSFFKNDQQLDKRRNYAIVGQNKSADKKSNNHVGQHSPTHFDSSRHDRKNYNENTKPEDGNQYQKLHEKLNFLQDKISEMRINLQIRKEEKKKYFQQEMKQRKQLLESEWNANSQGNTTNNNFSKGINKLPIDKTKNSENLMKQLVTQVTQEKKYKPFSFDPYSPRHNIYYVSEIIRAYKEQNSLAREHLINSIQLIKIMNRTRVPTQASISSRVLKLSKKPQYQDKKTVILDLDQTLIHCNENATIPSDIKLPIKFPTGETIEAGINIRPYAQEFLKQLSKNFELIVFTASHSCYANVVISYLDPENKYISHRLFREHCYQTAQNVYIKDIRIINRQLQNMVLVDNAAYSYAFQLDNGIPILPYYEGKVDFELKMLQVYIEGLMFSKDVRENNRSTFKLNRYLQYNDPQKLVQQLYLCQEGR